MTRINLVPVTELCDQHLIAEHRELKRVPNAIAAGRYSLKGQPAAFKLNEGHVKFFYDKLAFLRRRYEDIFTECRRRGFRVSHMWNASVTPETHASLFGDYEPTAEAIALSRTKIKEMMPRNARFTAWKETKI